MAYVIKVMVQLPDGNFARLPVARSGDSGFEVVKKDTKQEAIDWKEIILPDRAIVYEVK